MEYDVDPLKLEVEIYLHPAVMGVGRLGNMLQEILTNLEIKKLAVSA